MFLLMCGIQETREGHETKSNAMWREVRGE